MSRNWKHETETEMTNIHIIVSVNCIVNVFLNCVNPDKMSIMWVVSMLVSLCQLQSVLSYCYLISSLENHCIVCPVSLSLPLHPSISFPLLITAAVSLLRSRVWCRTVCSGTVFICFISLKQLHAPPLSSLIHCKSAVLLFTLLCLWPWGINVFNTVLLPGVKTLCFSSMFLFWSLVWD